MRGTVDCNRYRPRELVLDLGEPDLRGEPLERGDIIGRSDSDAGSHEPPTLSQPMTSRHAVGLSSLAQNASAARTLRTPATPRRPAATTAIRCIGSTA